MPLIWLVYRNDHGLTVYIREAQDLLFARLMTEMSGAKGEFVEGHQLDAGTALKIPLTMIGRALSAKEAQALLAKIA